MYLDPPDQPPDPLQLGEDGRAEAARAVAVGIQRSLPPVLRRTRGTHVFSSLSSTK